MITAVSLMACRRSTGDSAGVTSAGVKGRSWGCSAGSLTLRAILEGRTGIAGIGGIGVALLLESLMEAQSEDLFSVLFSDRSACHVAELITCGRVQGPR
jgi:hypothetical protein